MRSLFLASLIGTASAALAADWPQFRGPTADGVSAETSLADEWPAAGPPLVWSRELGVGYSGFAVAGGRVYTQVQSLYQQSVECLDAATGRTIWSHSYGLPFDGGAYPGPRATPTVNAGRVFFAAPNGLVGCLEVRTGAEVWSQNLKTALDGKGTDFGVSASPVIAEGLVLVPVGGPAASLVALDPKTGAVVWKCGERPASYATPLVVQWQGRSLVVAPLENSILLADVKSGRALFELKLSHGYDEHSAAPVYREPFLFLSAPFRSGGTCYRLVAEEDDGCRLEQVWDTRKMSNDIASCVLAGDTLFGFDLKDPQARLNRPSRGEFRALDFATGNVLWSSAAAGHANVIAADGKLILFNDRGELVLLRQSTEKYDELARTAVFQDEICWTAAALADGYVFVRTSTRAACLDLRANRSQAGTQTVADIPQARRINPQWLLGGEREFPATPPDGAELRLWFDWNALGLLVAWLIAAAVMFGRGAFARDALFFTLAIALGICGGMLVNRLQSQYVFTLPLALWAAGQATFDVAVAAQRAKARNAAWLARGTLALFIVGCAAYFHFCRRIGLSIEWSFLIGFLPAFPFTLAAAYARTSRRASWIVPLARLGSFATYYWFSAAYIVMRLIPG